MEKKNHGRYRRDIYRNCLLFGVFYSIYLNGFSTLGNSRKYILFLLLIISPFSFSEDLSTQKERCLVSYPEICGTTADALGRAYMSKWWSSAYFKEAHFSGTDNLSVSYTTNSGSGGTQSVALKPLVCPTGQQLNTTTNNCDDICVLPEIKNTITGKCQKPCPDVGDSLSINYLPSSSNTGSRCVGGCRVWVNDAKCDKSVCIADSVSTGSFCASSSTTPAGYVGAGSGDGSPPSDPCSPMTAYCCIQKGMSSGVVNGVTVCTTPTSKNPLSDNTVGSETVTNDDGSTTTKTTDTTTTNTGSGIKTSTTETTTTTNASGVSSTTVTKTESDEPTTDYCKKNPTAKICLDANSKFSGSCGSFNCSGDAIQCAAALDQHKRNCQLFDDKTSKEWGIYSDLSSGKDLMNGKNPLDSANKGIVDLNGSSGSIDTSRLFNSAQCLPNKTISIFDQSITIDSSKFCSVVALMGYLFVAVSLLNAVRIIKGGAE